jgi:hypothetical protein
VLEERLAEQQMWAFFSSRHDTLPKQMWAFASRHDTSPPQQMWRFLAITIPPHEQHELGFKKGLRSESTSSAFKPR